MNLNLIFILPIILSGTFAAAQSLSVVCVAGQCVQGISNTSLGATLNAPGAPTSLHLLPGTYTTTTNPQLLHNIITSSGATLAPLPGFANATQAFNPSSLPLELSISPGITIYGGVRYSGQANYSGFPQTPSDLDIWPAQISATSFVLSDNVYVVLSGSSDGDDRVVFWNSVPDTTQLPLFSSSSSPSTLNIFDLSSTTCNPSCSSNGICSPTNNTCICAPGFTGTLCESCSPGFFGPKCQACPSGCDQCDDGTQGTGRCLKETVVGSPESCGCVNGQCGSNGQCTCNAGWKDGNDGTKCSTCQDGFFLTSSGDCQICLLGCSQCADTTGSCTQCQQGLSIDPKNNTICDTVQQLTSGQVCPKGTFSNGAQCSPCSSACQTCTGTTADDCVLCASGTYLFNGKCVATNGGGACNGATGMIANNLKNECDACPSKCTSCQIPAFSNTSPFEQLQCTGCLPGFVLLQGKCVESCPAGTFLSPQDNLTCIPCDSSCNACADSADFCLTCNGTGQLAFGGKCVSSCPSNTFTSNSSSCATCHNDCASCSGPQFNQCTACPTSRPNLKAGRCLPTCAQNEYFNKNSSSCTSCDSSCSTCSASGSDQCLSCPEGEVLRQGKCVQSNGGCKTLSGLGVCLSELVIAPQASTTGTNGPLPSITGISDPTKVTVKFELQWWQIVLMVLGCLFLGLLVVVLWRRHARKKRVERTKAWATQRGVLGGKGGSWWRRMFKRKARGAYDTRKGEKDGLPSYRDEVISEHPGSTVDGFIDVYGDKRSSWEYYDQGSRSSLGSRSLFSEITGERRRVPEPRMPVREHSLSVKSLRTTKPASMRSRASSRKPASVETEAERYARSVREESHKQPQEQTREHPGAAPFLATEPLNYWVPSNTTERGTHARNPFRK